MSGTPTLGALATAELWLYRLATGLGRAALAAWLVVPGRSTHNVAWEERLGRWPEAPRVGRTVWVHAASLGELAAVRPLLLRLRAVGPPIHLLVTCNTATGRELAATFPADEVRYFPLDSRAIIRRLLDRIRPVLFVFVETEIWPVLLLELARRGIPTAMVNARISARSYPRYRLIAPLVGAALASVARICARDEESRRRLLNLGAKPEAIHTTGDLKLEAMSLEQMAATPDLLADAQDGPPVIVAISTREGEEEPVLRALECLRALQVDARLVLLPRHPERAGQARELAARLGFRVALWSAGVANARDWQVLIVDRTGEARGFMKSARAAYVGGSLVPLGGHNLLEPAAFGLPVVTGPYLENVREQAETLSAQGALEVVEDSDGLAATWRRWVEDRDEAQRVGRAAREAVERACGSLDRTMRVIGELLPA